VRARADSTRQHAAAHQLAPVASGLRIVGDVTLKTMDVALVVALRRRMLPVPEPSEPP
jgi:hypothetical protein